MNMTARLILPLSLAIVAAGPVDAAQISMTFTATGFVPDTDWSDPAPPTNPVSGAVVWDGFGFLSNGNGLISIDLTIDGHVYTPDEVSLLVDPSGFVLAANANGFNAVVTGTNDFVFGYEPGNPDAPLFLYATSQHHGYWRTSDIAITTDPPGVVPIPPTAWLLGTGIAALAGGRRRFAGGQARGSRGTNALVRRM